MCSTRYPVWICQPQQMLLRCQGPSSACGNATVWCPERVAQVRCSSPQLHADLAIILSRRPDCEAHNSNSKASSRVYTSFRLSHRKFALSFQDSTQSGHSRVPRASEPTPKPKGDHLPCMPQPGPGTSGPVRSAKRSAHHSAHIINLTLLLHNVHLCPRPKKCLDVAKLWYVGCIP